MNRVVNKSTNINKVALQILRIFQGKRMCKEDLSEQSKVYLCLSEWLLRTEKECFQLRSQVRSLEDDIPHL